MTSDQRDEAKQRDRWQASPVADHPVGPDDAGNAVMFGLGVIASGWRWVTEKIGRRTG